MIDPNEAVIIVMPAATPLASPWVPGALLIVATLGLLEDAHMTVDVITLVLRSA